MHALLYTVMFVLVSTYSSFHSQYHMNKYTSMYRVVVILIVVAVIIIIIIIIINALFKDSNHIISMIFNATSDRKIYKRQCIFTEDIQIHDDQIMHDYNHCVYNTVLSLFKSTTKIQHVFFMYILLSKYNLIQSWPNQYNHNM